MSEKTECRLCGGAATPIFKKLLLGRHDVSFLKCECCVSLQTEAPYWLEEAYSDDRPLSDCGMVARTVDLCAKTDLIFSVLGVEEKAACVDFGGSLGLYSRMMRDRGYNFFRKDKFSRNFYVPFHDADECEVDRPCVVTSFEVMEHLSNPKQELSDMFASSPDVLVATTAVYRDQASDWWYFAPDIGQHVFFYSATALQAIAECYQMHLLSDGQLHLFIRKQPQQLGYSVEAIRQTARFLGNPQLFHSESMRILLSRLGDPYKYASRDYSEILETMNARRKTNVPSSLYLSGDNVHSRSVG